jgi:galactokinase
MNITLRHRVEQEFSHRFEQLPEYIVRAPGRVNLIGEHTDYNDGFVLPMAIDRAVWIALRKRSDRIVRVYSLDYAQWMQFDLRQLTLDNSEWGEYIKGMAYALQEAGYELQGWEGVLAGDVPIGAGLSSSAALELASGRAFSVASDLPWDPAEMARLGQQAENKWMGVQSGIMDQMISARGKAGHALLIDCRSLEVRQTPLPDGVAVVILDTATRRDLVDSAYNERRRQCEAAARYFGVKALRDVTFDEFTQREAGMEEVTRRRARHVISENERTLEAAQALVDGEVTRFGELMNLSHLSLRDDFEVSSHELNVMVELAQSLEGCFGARMTGAGFGGCAVALVAGSAAEGFARHIHQQYQSATGLEPAIYICSPADGASLV